jgi:hypothetical protein
MGLFPIFMNVIQFWLIDSIVKASGNAEVALPFNQPDSSDREPLFHSLDDDDCDDDDGGARGVGDAIATPAKRDIEAHTQGQVQLLRRSTDSSHTYPPRHDDSPTLTGPTVYRGSLSPPPSLSSMISSRRHRPPPAPLLPRSPMPPAQNSPDPSCETSRADADADRQPKEDWQSWDGEGDWAERVGEEEWTGRRAEAKKDEVEGQWRGEAP